MEEIERTYKLPFEHQAEFFAVLDRPNYAIEDMTVCEYQRIKKCGKAVGEIRDSLGALKISAFLLMPEGRTLDKLLAEWKPGQK